MVKFFGIEFFDIFFLVEKVFEFEYIQKFFLNENFPDLLFMFGKNFPFLFSCIFVLLPDFFFQYGKSGKIRILEYEFSITESSRYISRHIGKIFVSSDNK